MNRGFSYIDRAQRPGTLLGHLARYGHSSAGDWARRLAAGEIRVDGRVVLADRPIAAGAEVRWDRPPWEEEDVPRDWTIAREDADTLVVVKPSGLPTVPAGGFLENTLLHLVRRDFPGVTPMHRLGRGTSGLVLFARTPDARSRLQAAFRDRAIRKVYRALVEGAPPSPFVVDAPIGPVPHPLLGTVSAASAEGRPSLTRGRVVRDGVVEVEIETGRPHQIRVHMAALGHPLVADPLYGRDGPRPDALPGDLGYLLHAMVLEYPGPSGGIRVEAAPPDALR